MKQLELLLARFNSRAKQLVDWNEGKQVYLSEDVKKIEQISAIQARIKGQEAFDQELKSVHKTFEETKVIGQEVIDAKHEAEPQVQQTISTSVETLAATGDKSANLTKELNEWLKFKQEVEANCIDFANQVQQLNLFLEDLALAFIELVSANSVAEVEEKQSGHEQLTSNHAEKKAVHDSITELHNKIAAAGADSGVYSSFSYDAITEKYNKIATQLSERAEEWAKCKQVQEYNEQILNEWSDLAKEYQTFAEEKKGLLQKEEGSSLYEQLQDVQDKSKSILPESQTKIAALQAHFDKLVAADVAQKVEIPFAELTVLHSNLESLAKRRADDLQLKLKQLDGVVGRFKSRMAKINEWQAEKSQYVANVVNKVNSISQIQAEIKTLSGLDNEFKGIETTYEETKGLGEVIIMSKHNEADSVKQTMTASDAANSKIQQDAKSALAVLQDALTKKQELEEQCVQFSKDTQELNLFLDDANNVLVESAKARSVKDVEDKLAVVNKISDTYKERAELLQNAKDLDAKVVAAGGKSNVYR